MTKKTIPDLSKITLFKVKEKAELLQLMGVDEHYSPLPVLADGTVPGVDVLMRDYGSEVNFFPFFQRDLDAFAGKIYSVKDPNVILIQEDFNGFGIRDNKTGTEGLVQFWAIDDLSDSDLEQI